MAVVVMLAGCATAYKKSGLTGGYGETRIDSNHYMVYFNGNGYASEDRVWYFWIYRCAQLTREQGFAYFSVTPVQSNLNKTAFAPEQAGHLYAAVLDGDAQGHAIEVHSSGGGGGGFIYVPGAVIRTWHSKAIIAMYGANVPPRTVVLQAQSVLDLLAGYIKTNGSSAAPLRDAIYEQSAYALAPDNRLVNIHQYLLARRSVPFANPYSKAFVSSSNPPPPPPAPPPLPAMASTSASSTGMPGADADAARAQNAATQTGCGVVQPNGDSTYTAPCGSYDVVIRCDSGKCQPVHTIKARSDT
jgi:hypothetical protein